LTLDDFDWRERTLRVYQPKTKQVIPLPLTIEATGVLVNYLRKARPDSKDRHLFLRFQAPAGPLAPAMVSDALERCRRASGLKLPPVGAHVLRHSFAVHLLRQGVAIKTIGDTLGHREIDSTLVYLRLGLEDLRSVAMPLPVAVATVKRSSSVLYRPRQRAALFQRCRPKHFHSLLADELQRFVQLKRTLGCVYKIEAAMLGRWDDFLYRHYPKSRQLKPEMFLNWRPELFHLTPNVQCAYLRVVRNFLQFHARDHAETFIPDVLNLPKTTPPPLPRLVLPDEMAPILDAAQRLPPSATNPLRAETFRLGLILLFCCGLRRNELLRLTLDHIDLEQSLIRIENTKFHKSRLVPFSPTVANQVAMYLRQRQQMKVSMNPGTFLLANGIQGDKAYADHTLLAVWHQLCLGTHLLDRHGRPLRLHDLRHSFAVNTLQRWYAEGANVQAKLPHLATYLGHVSIASTHYYLKLTPELRQAAGQRFHQRFASLFTKGGIA
jgi:integrase